MQNLAEVTRENRIRAGAAGTACTVEEELGWRQKAVLFPKRGSQGQGDRKKKLRKLSLPPPRLSAVDHMKALHNALVAGTGRGLEQSDNLEVLQRSGLLDGTADVSCPGPAAVLCLCTGEDSKPWSAFNFLKGSLGLCLEPVRDPFHRAWKNMSSAIRRSGLWPTFLNAVLIFNLSYGPWQGHGCFNQQQGQAADLA